MAAWTSLLVPLGCPGCGAVDEVVCPGCRGRLLRGPLLVRPLADGTVAVASAPWRGPARGLVVAAKESGRRDVGDVLALAVARAVAALAWGEASTVGRAGPLVGPLLLVPPPARTAAVLRRGCRPTADLARASAALLRAAGADVRAVELLRHTRRVRDQAGLSRAERADNLSGAFSVGGRTLRPRQVRGVRGSGEVVVVDDVMTTGATVLQCARALHEGGFTVRGAALVASA